MGRLLRFDLSLLLLDFYILTLTLSFILVVIDTVDVHYADVVVPILHAICATTSSKNSMTLSIHKSSFLTRALQALNINLI